MIYDDDVFILSHWKNMRGERYQGWGTEIPGLSPRGEYQQWHIIAAPDHEFLKEVVIAVSKNIDEYTPFTHGVGSEGVVRTTGPHAYTLAIQQIEKTAQYRLVEIEDLGFNYSILSTDTNIRMHAMTPTHHGFQRSPIIASDLPLRFS